MVTVLPLLRCTINVNRQVGVGYTLTSASTGLTTTVSTTFTVALGPASKVAYTQPAHRDGCRGDDLAVGDGHGARRRQP